MNDAAATTCMAIAHRGASSYAPENTHAAFELALQQGARHLELDVHLSADQQLVVIHDATLERTTNGSGRVAATPLSALQDLDAGSWFGEQFAGERIPLLAEVLERYRGRSQLHIELKAADPSVVPAVLHSLQQRAMVPAVTLTSFRLEHLQRARALAKELRLGYLVRKIDAKVVDAAVKYAIRQLCPRADWLTPQRVQTLRAEGFTVRAWGVKDECQMRHALRCGVDGMTVNFPDKLVAALQAGAS